MIKQRRTCRVCERDIVEDYRARVECCGQLMRRRDYEFPVRTPEEAQSRTLHMIALISDPDVKWSLPEKPSAIFEIWQLPPGAGRQNGEKLGWVGTRLTTVEWAMPPGIKIRGGFANTVEEAVGHMLEAMEGGIFAAQNIHAELA